MLVFGLLLGRRCVWVYLLCLCGDGLLDVNWFVGWSKGKFVFPFVDWMCAGVCVSCRCCFVVFVRCGGWLVLVGVTCKCSCSESKEVEGREEERRGEKGPAN